MDYAQSKELSLHIISSMNLSVHFNKYEVDNEKDLDGIKYIIERNKANILANFAIDYYKLWRFTLPIILSGSRKYSLYRFGFPYSWQVSY